MVNAKELSLSLKNSQAISDWEGGEVLKNIFMSIQL